MSVLADAFFLIGTDPFPPDGFTFSVLDHTSTETDVTLVPKRSQIGNPKFEGDYANNPFQTGITYKFLIYHPVYQKNTGMLRGKFDDNGTFIPLSPTETDDTAPTPDGRIIGLDSAQNDQVAKVTTINGKRYIVFGGETQGLNDVMQIDPVAEITPFFKGGVAAQLPDEPPGVDYPHISIGPDGTFYKVNNDTVTPPAEDEYEDVWDNFVHYDEITGALSETFVVCNRSEFTPIGTDPVSRGVFRIIDAAHSNPLLCKEGLTVQLRVEEQFSDDQWRTTTYTVSGWALTSSLSGVSVSSSGLFAIAQNSLSADGWVGVTASVADGHDTPVQATVQLSKNRPPVWDIPYGFTTGYKDVPQAFVWPTDHYSDPDNDNLTLSLQYSTDASSWTSTLPGWVSFDPGTRAFGFTCPTTSGGGQPQTYWFRRIVSDGRGGVAYDVFFLSITLAP